MPAGFGNRCSGRPAGADAVVSRVEGTGEVGAGRASEGHDCGVGFGVGPILIVRAEGVGRVGKGYEDLQAAGGNQRGFDFDGYFIAVGVDGGLDVDGEAVDDEGTGEDARPEIEPLVDIGEIGNDDG